MSVFSNVENSAGYIYYDLQLFNIGNNKTPDDISHLKFQETRSQPLVTKADDYDMSITRFQCDTYSLPIYEAEITPNQGNPDAMDLFVYFIYNDGVHDPNLGYNSGNVRMLWERVDFTKSVPVPPNQTPTGFQVDSSYYYSYDYSHILRMVNLALDKAMIAIRAGFPFLPDYKDLTNVEAPFLVWQKESNSANLYARADYFDVSKTPTVQDPVIEIYFNRSLYAMFNSFPVRKFSPINNFSAHYQIMVDSVKNSRVISGNFQFETERFICLPQEYSTISQWAPVSSLVFTSATLPIVVNQLSNVHLFQNNNLIQLSGATNNFRTIITDLSTNEQSYRPDIIYTPTGEYRWISLTTSQPISQFTLEVYWKSKVGKLIPFHLPAGGSCSMKVLFRKKQY